MTNITYYDIIKVQKRKGVLLMNQNKLIELLNAMGEDCNYIVDTEQRRRDEILNPVHETQ